MYNIAISHYHKQQQALKIILLVAINVIRVFTIHHMWNCKKTFNLTQCTFNRSYTTLRRHIPGLGHKWKCCSASRFHLNFTQFFLINRTNTSKQFNKRHFLYINFFTCTYFTSAAEGIKPIAQRLRNQSLAAELSASTFTQFFTELAKKKTI